MATENILEHYKHLWDFNFNRHNNKENYKKMRYYMADVLLSEIERHTPVDGKRILDVGGANGEFCKILSEKRDCKATNIDPDPHDPVWEDTLKGSAAELPFPDSSFDIVILRAVVEHIPHNLQEPSVREAYRVLKPGGIAYFLIPPWYNPFAGHQVKPFHYFSFPIAKSLREFFFRSKIKGHTYTEEGLFSITLSHLENLIRGAGFTILEQFDTHFRLHFLTKIPIIREIAIPAVSMVVTKPKS